MVVKCVTSNSLLEGLLNIFEVSKCIELLLTILSSYYLLHSNQTL